MTVGRQRGDILYELLTKIDKKNSETVVNALVKQSRNLPGELYKSLIWDRGTEMAKHQRFTMATKIKVYFCDPKSP
jgi:IS30 family transposase